MSTKAALSNQHTPPTTLRDLAHTAHTISQANGWYDGYHAQVHAGTHPSSWVSAWEALFFHPEKRHDRSVPRPLEEHTLALHTEISEAWQTIRTSKPETRGDLAYRTHDPLKTPKPVGLASELADILILCGDATSYWGIDLVAATHRSIRNDLAHTEGAITLIDFAEADGVSLRAVEAYGRERHHNSWGASRFRDGPAEPRMYVPFLNALHTRVQMINDSAVPPPRRGSLAVERDPGYALGLAFGDIVRITSLVAGLAQVPLVETTHAKLADVASRPYHHGKLG